MGEIFVLHLVVNGKDDITTTVWFPVFCFAAAKSGTKIQNIVSYVTLYSQGRDIDYDNSFQFWVFILRKYQHFIKF